MTHTPAEVIARLGELTPDEIARLFADEDVVGLVCTSDECPVARYIWKVTGEYIQVGPSVWQELEFAARQDLPRNVDEFVKRFDSGQYPYLIEGEES